MATPWKGMRRRSKVRDVFRSSRLRDTELLCGGVLSPDDSQRRPTRASVVIGYPNGLLTSKIRHPILTQSPGVLGTRSVQGSPSWRRYW